MLDLITLRFFKLAIVILGSIMAYYSGRGYLRNRSRAMLILAVGFFCITGGAFAAGFLFELAGYGPIEVYAIDSILQLLGFSFVVYSVVGKVS